MDTEAPQRADGERPNQQVRVVGLAELTPDDGSWTKRIWQKYHDGPIDPAFLDQRIQGRDRVLIKVRPLHMVAIGST